MRRVALRTALAFGVAAFSLSAPAWALPVKKDVGATSQRAAPAKLAPAARTAKKAAVGKPHAVASTTKPAKTAAAGKNAAAGKQAVTKQSAAKAVAPTKKASLSKKGREAYASAHATPRKLRRVAMMDTAAAVDTATATATASVRVPRLFAYSNPVDEARRWIGSNPTDRNSLWCATFMNFVLERSGYQGTGSDAAKSFASYGRRISGPRVGAIAVMTRGRNGGHVGIVSGVDSRGNPIVISGNHNKQVGESVYPRSRVIAYVMPR